MMVKIQKRTINSIPRVGLDGDVESVSSPGLRKPPKSGQKFATLQIYTSSKQLKLYPPE